MLYYIILLYYISIILILYYIIILYIFIIFYYILYYTILYYIIFFYYILYYIIFYYIILYYFIIHPILSDRSRNCTSSVYGFPLEMISMLLQPLFVLPRATSHIHFHDVPFWVEETPNFEWFWMMNHVKKPTSGDFFQDISWYIIDGITNTADVESQRSAAPRPQ